MFTFYDYTFSVPLVVLNINLFHVLYSVQTAGSSPICMTVVYLHLVAFLRPAAILVNGMKIQTWIRSRCGHYVGLEFKVSEIMIFHITIIKKVRHGSIGYYCAVLNRKCWCVVANFPTVKRFTVKKGYPSICTCFMLWFAGNEYRQNGNRQEKIFHVIVLIWKNGEIVLWWTDVYGQTLLSTFIRTMNSCNPVSYKKFFNALKLT